MKKKLPNKSFIILLILIMENNNDDKFNKWLDLVNKHIYSKLKIHLTDLPDNTFRIDFDNNLPPKEMAQKVVKDTEWEELYLT